MTTTVFSKFDAGQKSGATTLFVFALLSTLALSLVFVRVLSVAVRSMIWKQDSDTTSREAFFFRSQLGQYSLCLLFSNWLSSIAGIIEIDWVNAGGVVSGSSCTSQVILSQMGQFGTSYFIVAMGVHTFNSLVLRNRHPNWVGIAIILIGFLATIAIGAGPAGVSDRTSGPLYGVLSLDCGISKMYPVAHMLLYFLPLYVATLISSIIYSLIFLVLRGTLTINGGLKIRMNPQQRWRAQSSDFEEYQRFVSSIARSMLWFPATFSICILPSSIVQLMDISGSPATTGAMTFALILIHLNGVINVLILLNILRVLGPAVRSPGSSIRSTDIEKGGSFEKLGEPTFRPAFAPRTHVSPPRENSDLSASRQPNKANRQGSITWRTTPFISHHKGVSSTDSTSRLLTPIPEHGHSHSASNASTVSTMSAASLQRNITPVADLNEKLLPSPPAAMQRVMPVVPKLHTLLDYPSRSSEEHVPTQGLTAAPRKTRSPVSRDSLSGDAAVPQSPPAFREILKVQERSPTGDGDGHSSLISMYLSRSSVHSDQLPAFPSNVHESVAPRSGSDKVGHGLQTSASITAVGGHRPRSPIPPPLPTPPSVISPGFSSPSNYATTDYTSDSDIALSPPLLSELPAFPRHPPLAALRPESSDAPREGDGSGAKVTLSSTAPLRLSGVPFASLVVATSGPHPGRSQMPMTDRPPSTGSGRTARESAISMRALPVPPTLRPGSRGRASLEEPPRVSVAGLHIRKLSARAEGAGSFARVSSLVAADPAASVHKVHASKPQFGRTSVGQWEPGHARGSSAAGNGSQSYGYL